jgi:hypothetical protein
MDANDHINSYPPTGLQPSNCTICCKHKCEKVPDEKLSAVKLQTAVDTIRASAVIRGNVALTNYLDDNRILH